MAKPVKRRGKGKAVTLKSSLPFQTENYILFAIGIGVLILGYIALSIGPWDSFMSLTLAPVLLVLAFCIIFPVAILYKKKIKQQDSEVQQKGD